MFFVSRAIIELRKRGVIALALTKKHRYWPKYIDNNAIDKHFKDKDVGSVDSLPGEMLNIPFHVFGMKDPDYVMKLMSTYGTNVLQLDHLANGNILSTKKRCKKSSIIQKLYQTISNKDMLWTTTMLKNTPLFV